AASYRGATGRRPLRVTWAVAIALALSAVALARGGGVAAAAEVTEQQVVAGAHAARIEAEIDPQGKSTECRAQYVAEAQWKASGWAAARTVACAPGRLGSGTTAVPVTAALAGLQIQTSYVARLETEAEGASGYGPQERFATFGFKSFSFEALSEHGAPVVQAGAHPYQLRAAFVTNTTRVKGVESRLSIDGILRDLLTELPPGLLGNPTAVPACTARQAEENECSGNSQIGTIALLRGSAPKPEVRALDNTVPPEGTAAQFAGEVNLSADAYIDAGVRTGSDYGITAGSTEITPLGGTWSITVTMWGDPLSRAHDPERLCPAGHHLLVRGGCEATLPEGRPFLTMPTACLGQLPATARLDSYEAPSEYVSASVLMPAITGCSALAFDPGLETAPSTSAADSASGLNVALSVPQNEAPAGTASSDLKDATITFPAGFAVNPSSADGLAACPQTGAEGVGFTGFAELNPKAEPGVETAQFTPEPARCPEASKLGVVEIDTPLLSHPIEGGLYLATPHRNPFGSLIAVYLAVHDPISGVVIKLPGQVSLDQQTGQLTTTFDQNPQLPFEKLEVNLFNDAKRAALSTPETCGSYASTSSLTPWDGNPAATPSSRAFAISSEPGGGACATTEAQAPNAPGFEAGTASPIAGSYSPFVVKLKREDGSQRFQALNVTLPPGMTGRVAGVQECPQADIEAAQRLNAEGDGAIEQAHPSCPAGSEVGVVKVGAGSGAPLYVGGKAYFAGPYDGAPFSLVIVTPAVAGPFDLGNVVVRSGIYINPTTAQVTVQSDRFPSILDGIPLDIRSLDVEITRPEFTLNPTSCNAMAVTGRETSTAGQTAALSDRFQVGGCGTLPFHPSFSASTRAGHTRRDGAALTVKLDMGSGQANVAKVHVELPKKLPSELKTLKLACTEAQFAANPAACPKESMVGYAVAHTPILPVPLQGPAIFVSHGGAGFPNLDLVLQGDGVNIDLVGDTFINERSGITTSTFATVPDVPVSQFELTLPEQPYSALGGNGSFCEAPLYMPTSITAQNGAVVQQRTRIAVTGCRPRMRVLGHSVHGARAKIRIRVPSAGRLVVSGRGIVKAARRVRGPKVVTIAVRLTRRDRRAAARHRQRIRVRLTLRFKPKRGGALLAHARLLLR
ncbi:MAG: hypothetical protein ACYCYN_13985, partial [Solirubrobacteraceae bacterium]